MGEPMTPKYQIPTPNGGTILDLSFLQEFSDEYDYFGKGLKQTPRRNGYRKRRITLLLAIFCTLVGGFASLVELGFRDYFFNYLHEQTADLFHSGEPIVLRENQNKFCVVKSGACERPTRNKFLARGLKRVGEVVSSPFRRKQKSTGEISVTSRDASKFMHKLDAEIERVPKLKQRAEKVKWPIDDSNLRRWIDAFGMKETLIDQIQNTVQWREQFGTCCMRSKDFSDFAHSNVHLDGTDRFGRPILLLAPSGEGVFDAKEHLRVLIYNVEQAIQNMGKGVERFAVVVDFGRFDSGSLPPASFFTEMFSILGSHYPGRLGVVLVANASGSVQFLWKMVSAVLSERTRKKIFFLGDNETPRSLLDKISSAMVEPKPSEL